MYEKAKPSMKMSSLILLLEKATVNFHGFLGVTTHALLPRKMDQKLETFEITLEN